MNEITNAPIINFVPVVSQPELIRVAEIKKKHLNQLPKLEWKQIDESKHHVVGIYYAGDFSVVVLQHVDTGHLFAVGLVWFQQFLMAKHNGGPTSEAGIEKVRNAILANYPQLFEK